MSTFISGCVSVGSPSYDYLRTPDPNAHLGAVKIHICWKDNGIFWLYVELVKRNITATFGDSMVLTALFEVGWVKKFYSPSVY